MAVKSTQEMVPDGEAEWLLLVYEKMVTGVRAYTLPESKDGVLKITTPPLLTQAFTMRRVQGPTKLSA